MAAHASLTEDDTDVTGQIPMPQNAAGHNLSFLAQSGIPGQYGIFSVDANGAYSYQLNNTLPSVQGLGEGQTLTETFTYTMGDGAGGVTSNTVTITINGLNDAPTVDSAATSILEDQDHTTGILPTPQDIDTDDSPQYLTQTNSAGQYGYLSLNSDGTYTYTLDNSLPIVQRLGVGDFLTETFTYTVDDGHGGTASGNLVITIHGTNDVPTVAAATAEVDEDGPVLMGVLPTPHDVDAGDVPQFVPQTGSVGAYGVLTVDAQGNYSYVLDNSRPEIQALSQGDTLTEQFVFTVTDGQSYVSKTLTITINGTNDVPTVAASSASLTEHQGLVGGTLPTPHDVDANDTLNFIEQHNAPGQYGNFSVDAAGNYTYVLDYAAPDLQHLAEGQQLTEVFTYTVYDNHGGMASNTITITINGVNDAPQVSAAVASIDEDVASISGTLPAPTDADAGDVAHFVPQADVPGQYGSFTLQADGTYSYTLDNALPVVQQLGVGSQLIETFTYTVTDQHGATASNTITITINGTNSAPQVSAATASIFEDDASISGTLPTPTDVNANDVVLFQPQTDAQGQYGSFTLQADGSYTYTLDNALPVVQQLGVGAHLTETFTYTVTDQHGATASNTITITINGTNDAPQVSAAVITVPGDATDVSGTLPTPTDVDVGDVPQYDAQNTVGQFGTFTLQPDGSYTFTLDNSLPAVAQLSAGEQLTETFTATVRDPHGATSTSTITITINGTNSAPQVSAATASIFEDDASISGTLPTPTDVNANDVVLFQPQTDAQGQYGSFTLQADGSYTYTLNNALDAVQQLGVGAHLTETFTYTVTDQHGATASNTITITINGTNDAPQVSAAVITVPGDATDVSGTLPTPTDVDAGDVPQYDAQNTVGQFGTFTLQPDGSYTFTLDNSLPAVAQLGAGEQLTETFTATVRDPHGATSTSTITITINGTNSAPQVSAATASIFEDDASISGTLPTPTDVNANDVVLFMPQTNAQGQYGSFTLQADGSYTYTLDNALPVVQQLGVGAHLTETFTYTVTDQHGATASNTITITINGTNDAPQVSAA
ncbi:MAG: VCBS domain-containing protein, partial [Desulfuromonadaceae bacterium]|nr:VCBS domain-containing protein [Desulfuromonadaceae bacterium]